MQSIAHRDAAARAFQAGDIIEAIARMRDAVRSAPQDLPLAATLGEYLWANYEFEEALRIFEICAEAQVDNSLLCAQVAQKHFSLGRFESAALWLKKAVQRNPADAALKTMLGEIHERCDRLDDAEQLAHEALSLDPENIKASRLHAHILRRRGDMTGAAKLLQDRLRRASNPEDWRLRMELAAVLDRLGEYDDAMREMILAKEQLRPLAAPHLKQATAIRARQLEVAHALKPSDFARWFTPENQPADPARIAILCGHPRSGTTLLEQILASHPQVVSTDETGVWQKEFLDPLIRQPASAAEAVSELNSFDAEQIAAGRSSYLRCTEAHLAQAINGRLLVEKDPSLTPDLPLPLRLFPESKVIFPIRDPRDICISYFFTIVPLNSISGHALDLKSTATFCAHSFEMWRHWRDALPCPKLEARYEQLVADPPGESRRLLDFLGLEWDERVLRFYEKSFSKGVRTPTYADVAQPIYKRASGRWKNYERHIESCMEILEPALREFGYA